MRPFVAAATGVLLALLAGCGGGRATSAGPAGPATAGAITGADWPTYHHDVARTGVAAGVPAFGGLTKAWTARLDGAVYGQPLVVGGTVYAATEGDSVYALDPATGKVRWRRNLGTPVPLDTLPCGNIDPLGITGTAAYDAGTGLIYVVAETTGYHHTLVGVSAKDGTVKVTRDIPAPDGNPRNDQQRPGLTIAHGRVYVTFGGLIGDCGQYVGSVVGIKLDGTGDLAVYKVPTQRMGAIWGTGGATVDQNGVIYVTTGNGAAVSGAFDGSDSVTALDAGLKPVGQFAPTTWADDNAKDLDLSSMSPALVGADRLLAVGKRGVGYLLRRPGLGRPIGGEIVQAKVCPAYGGPSVAGTTVYVPCPSGVAAVDVAGDRVKVLWRGPGDSWGSPVVAGGTVLVPGTGKLYALAAATGKVRAQVELPELPHFASPSVSGSLVLVGTMEGVAAVRLTP